MLKVVIITQDEPFFLAENFKILINNLPKNSKIVGCVLSKPSPFGKDESFLKKTHKTLRIFGFKFFLFYSFKYLIRKFQPKLRLSYLLKSYNIPIITLKKSINSKESVLSISQYNPDLLVSILGNQIFKAPIINLAPKGCLNLHTALLPKYRGLMPTFWVLKNNEKKSIQKIS